MNHRLFQNLYTGGILILYTVIKGEVVPLHVMKEYGGVASHFLNLSTK
jgi:hypothetical protein